MDDQEARERVARVEALLEGIESLADPAAREMATEMVEALLDLYGEGLARIMERAAAGGAAAEPPALADDELVEHLLFLHDLHPVPLDARVTGALDSVRPYLESHGGNVELLGLEDGVVRLRMQGSCSGCPSSSMTLKLAIEDAIHKAAPDVEAVEAVDAEPAEQPGPQLLQLEVADSFGGNGAGGDGIDAEWTVAGTLAELQEGELAVKDVAGDAVLFLRLDGTFYAYRPPCPGCGEGLEDATLDPSGLACQGCGNRYDVRRAGRCLDAPALHLEPVPLLVSSDGLVKVAVGSAVA